VAVRYGLARRFISATRSLIIATRCTKLLRVTVYATDIFGLRVYAQNGLPQLLATASFPRTCFVWPLARLLLFTGITHHAPHLCDDECSTQVKRYYFFAFLFKSSCKIEVDIIILLFSLNCVICDVVGVNVTVSACRLHSFEYRISVTYR